MYLYSQWQLIIAVVWVFSVNGAKVNRHKQRLVHYSIPEFRDLKKSIGYHEDSYLNFTELTSKYHYPTEQHKVITEDGYILTVYRIIPQCSEVKIYPVLLMHGIIDSSDLWIIAGPNDGLAYVLANNCYDVWLPNSRGNTYSRKHVRLDPDTDRDYWNFSFDELGNYDLPALVDYTLHVTKRLQLYYIGHSQGTTEFLVMNSLRPVYNRKIRLSILLAPVASLANIANPLAKAAAQLAKPIQAIIEGAGYNEFLARDQILHSLVELLCYKDPEIICGEILAIVSGYHHETIESQTLSVAFGHLLVGISTKSLAHFAQLITSKKFQRYDEGREGNIKRYGKQTPPRYNLSRVDAPVVLINAYNDWLATVKDVDILRSKLQNVVENYYVPEKYWSHNNHLWGIKAPIYVFPKILNYFNTYDIYT